jgi:hypothetical protein
MWIFFVVPSLEVLRIFDVAFERLGERSENCGITVTMVSSLSHIHHGSNHDLVINDDWLFDD